MNSKQIRNTLLLLLTALIWGCAFVAQSVGAEYVGAFTFLASRSWLAGFFLLPVIAIIGNKKKKTISEPQPISDPSGKKTLVIGGIVCGLFLFVASVTQQIGVAYTTTAKASFITALYVVIVPILTLFMGKKVGKQIWLCVVLGLIGLYLLCINGELSLGIGDTYVIICAFLYSGHILVIDHFSPKVDGVRMSCIQFFVCAAVSTICMFLFEHPSWEAIKQAGLPILYAGIMSSGVGYTLQIVGQKGLNPTIASLAMCMESVFGALAGWALLGQGLSTKELSGCVLMFIAIVLAQLPERQKKTNSKDVST